MARGCTVWLTGLSGSGKSTIAQLLSDRLEASGRTVTRLDGDEIRTHLTRGLSFSREDRDINVMRVAYVAREVVRHGGIAVASLISPYRETRGRARAMIGEFVEVFVDAPLEVCESRDVKGLYARARAGEIADFTGIDDPYEPPEKPEVHIRTDSESVEESVDTIITTLRSLEYVD
ncbi:MAG: adenylyl-sulfate kinase [Myxococcota bacterium]